MEDNTGLSRLDSLIYYIKSKFLIGGFLMAICSESMKCLKQLDITNWNKWSAWAAWAQFAFLFLPAFCYFFRKRLCYINCWFFDASQNGIKMAIHNKSRTSLFMLRPEICIRNSQVSHTRRSHISLNCIANYTCIKPDDVIYINIDYVKYNISPSDHITLYVRFAGKRFSKRKKIKRGTTYVCGS